MSDENIRFNGQALLIGQLSNGVAAKNAEIHAFRMAQNATRSRPSNSKLVDDLERENQRLKRELEDCRTIQIALAEREREAHAVFAKKQAESDEAMRIKDELLVE